MKWYAGEKLFDVEGYLWSSGLCTVLIASMKSSECSLCRNWSVKGLRMLVKTDSVQSSSSTCKNYLLKIYSQHGNFLNAI